LLGIVGAALAGGGIMRTAEAKNSTPPSMSMSMRANIVRDEIKRIADVYVGRIETQIAEWGARLADLAAQSEVGSSGVRVVRSQAVADLVSRYHATQTKLAAWKSAGNVKGGTYKLSVEQAWNDLESAFEDLRRGFSRRD
jgi:hypothetical protein